MATYRGRELTHLNVTLDSAAYGRDFTGISFDGTHWWTAYKPSSILAPHLIRFNADGSHPVEFLLPGTNSSTRITDLSARNNRIYVATGAGGARVYSFNDAGQIQLVSFTDSNFPGHGIAALPNRVYGNGDALVVWAESFLPELRSVVNFPYHYPGQYLTVDGHGVLYGLVTGQQVGADITGDIASHSFLITAYRPDGTVIHDYYNFTYRDSLMRGIEIHNNNLYVLDNKTIRVFEEGERFVEHHDLVGLTPSTIEIKRNAPAYNSAEDFPEEFIQLNTPLVSYQGNGYVIHNGIMYVLGRTSSETNINGQIIAYEVDTGHIRRDLQISRDASDVASGGVDISYVNNALYVFSGQRFYEYRLSPANPTKPVPQLSGLPEFTLDALDNWLMNGKYFAYQDGDDIVLVQHHHSNSLSFDVQDGTGGQLNVDRLYDMDDERLYIRRRRSSDGHIRYYWIDIATAQSHYFSSNFVPFVRLRLAGFAQEIHDTITISDSVDVSVSHRIIPVNDSVNIDDSVNATVSHRNIHDEIDVNETVFKQRHIVEPVGVVVDGFVGDAGMNIAVDANKVYYANATNRQQIMFANYDGTDAQLYAEISSDFGRYTDINVNSTHFYINFRDDGLRRRVKTDRTTMTPDNMELVSDIDFVMDIDDSFGYFNNIKYRLDDLTIADQNYLENVPPGPSGGFRIVAVGEGTIGYTYDFGLNQVYAFDKNTYERIESAEFVLDLSNFNTPWFMKTWDGVNFFLVVSPPGYIRVRVERYEGKSAVEHVELSDNVEKTVNRRQTHDETINETDSVGKRIAYVRRETDNVSITDDVDVGIYAPPQNLHEEVEVYDATTTYVEKGGTTGVTTYTGFPSTASAMAIEGDLVHFVTPNGTVSTYNLSGATLVDSFNVNFNDIASGLYPSGIEYDDDYFYISLHEAQSKILRINRTDRTLQTFHINIFRSYDLSITGDEVSVITHDGIIHVYDKSFTQLRTLNIPAGISSRWRGITEHDGYYYITSHFGTTAYVINATTGVRDTSKERAALPTAGYSTTDNSNLTLYFYRPGVNILEYGFAPGNYFLHDHVRIDDDAEAYFLHRRNFAETLEISDDVATSRAYIEPHSETVNIDDQVNTTQRYIRTNSESFGISDTVAKMQRYVREESDTITIDDSNLNITKTTSLVRSFVFGNYTVDRVYEFNSLGEYEATIATNATIDLQNTTPVFTTTAGVRFLYALADVSGTNRIVRTNPINHSSAIALNTPMYDDLIFRYDGAIYSFGAGQGINKEITIFPGTILDGTVLQSIYTAQNFTRVVIVGGNYITQNNNTTINVYGSTGNLITSGTILGATNIVIFADEDDDKLFALYELSTGIYIAELTPTLATVGQPIKMDSRVDDFGVGSGDGITISFTNTETTIPTTDLGDIRGITTDQNFLYTANRGGEITKYVKQGGGLVFERAITVPNNASLRSLSGDDTYIYVWDNNADEILRYTKTFLEARGSSSGIVRQEEAAGRGMQVDGDFIYLIYDRGSIQSVYKYNKSDYSVVSSQTLGKTLDGVSFSIGNPTSLVFIGDYALTNTLNRQELYVYHKDDFTTLLAIIPTSTLRIQGSTADDNLLYLIDENQNKIVTYPRPIIMEGGGNGIFQGNPIAYTVKTLVEEGVQVIADLLRIQDDTIVGTTKSRTIPESISINDSTSVSLSLGVTEPPITITDTTTKGSTKDKNLVDTININDNVLKDVSIGTTDQISIVDVARRMVNISQADTIQIEDDLVARRLVDYIQPISDEFEILELVRVIKAERILNITEPPITITDNVEQGRTLSVQSITEPLLSIVDTVSRSTHNRVDLTEPVIRIIDTVTRGSQKARTLVEPVISIMDNVIKTTAKVRNISDGFSITDSVSRLAQNVRTHSETIEIRDSVSRLGGIINDEIVRIRDEVRTIPQRSLIILDVISIIEAVKDRVRRNAPEEKIDLSEDLLERRSLEDGRSVRSGRIWRGRFGRR